MKLRNWLMIVLVLCLSPLSAFASSEILTTAQRETLYANAIMELEDYLYNKQDDPARLQGIIDSFGRARIGQSESLKSYALVLQLIAEDSYGYDLSYELKNLLKNKRFNTFLAEEMKDSPMYPVEYFEAYAEGRQAQSEGNTKAALQSYADCDNFFDAGDRHKQLDRELSASVYQQGKKLAQQWDLAGAYFQFKQAGAYSDSKQQMQTIVDMLGYTPKDAQDNLQPAANLRSQNTAVTSVTLAWSASEHATEYEISYRAGNSGNWTFWGTTEKTSVNITGLKQGTSYDFRVVACIGKTVRSEERVLSGVRTQTPAPTATPKPTQAPTPKPTATPKSSIAVGSYVSFGHYPQTAAGTDDTPIEWLVLEVQGNKALLISKYGLDAQPYNTAWEEVTWETCTLRTWLNNDFLNRAFTAMEQKAIVTTNVDNSKSQGYPNWDTTGGNNTRDQVFLLSFAEANKYFNVTGGGTYNIDSRVTPTAYAKYVGAYTSSGNKTTDGVDAGWWWLRSPGNEPGYAMLVHYVGSLSFYFVAHTAGCIRPALWVNLESFETLY